LVGPIQQKILTEFFTPHKSPDRVYLDRLCIDLVTGSRRCSKVPLGHVQVAMYRFQTFSKQEFACIPTAAVYNGHVLPAGNTTCWDVQRSREVHGCPA